MIGPKDRKFLDRRLEIAESEMSQEEKRAALKALKAEMDAWAAYGKRTIRYFLVNLLIFGAVCLWLIFSGHFILAYAALLPLLIQALYVMWKATR